MSVTASSGPTPAAPNREALLSHDQAHAETPLHASYSELKDPSISQKMAPDSRGLARDPNGGPLENTILVLNADSPIPPASRTASATIDLCRLPSSLSHFGV